MRKQHPRRPAGRRLPTPVVYLLLVGTPVLVTIALLSGGSDDGNGTTSVGAMAGHPLAKLLLAVAVVVSACKALGWLVTRLGQPAVIGEITAGLLLGPSALGAVWPAGAAAVLPEETVPQLNVLAQIGVVLFVFLTGLEINTRLLRGRGHTAVVVSHVSIAVPFLLGVLLAIVIAGRLAPPGISHTAFAMFLGVSMSVTALPVLIRILSDLGLLRSEVGVIALTCALIDDVSAWCLLALVVALVTASSALGVLGTVVLTGVFTAVLVLVARPLLARFAGRASQQTLHAAAPVALVVVLLCAMATEWIGVHAMFGAFLFGLVFPRGNVMTTWLEEKAGGLTTALLLPLFFASSGLRTDLGLLAGDATLWLWCGAILLVAVVGKLGGTAVAARAVGESWRRSLQLGALMNCRGLTELVVLNIGLELGVLSPTMFTMMVIMALVSTAMTGPLIRLLTPRGDRTVIRDRFLPPGPGEPPREYPRAA